MFFTFTFRHFLLQPAQLASDLKNATMQSFWRRVVLVFLLSLVLFSLRSMWGMNTEGLTALMATSTTDYTLARYAALFGSMIWSALYVAFHVFGLAYALSFIIGIPFKKLLPMQLLMTALLLVEKTIIFTVFYVTGKSMSLSFLSFGPLAATYFELPFFIYFFNQLTLTTVMIISYQYHFIRTYGDFFKKSRLLLTLIGIHLFMAIFVASIGLLPIEDLFNQLIGGGAANE